MSENIKVKDPDQIIQLAGDYARMVSDFRHQVTEQLKNGRQVLVYLSQTKGYIEQEINYIKVSIQQTSGYEDSYARQEAVKQLQAKLERYYQKSATLQNCESELESLLNNLMNISNNMSQYVDDSSGMAQMIENVMTRIKDML